MNQIVILDGYVANPGDQDWGPLHVCGNVQIYDRTATDQIVSRAREANIILTNKCPLDRSILTQLPKLEYIGLLATGYNNIDVHATDELGITVSNAVGYGAPSVAQHVFALLLELTNQVGKHSTGVKSNRWSSAPDWCYWDQPIVELQGKTIGIYGLGSIGSQVAKIALAFDMRVIATRRNLSLGAAPNVQLVTEEELFQQSDILSLHATLSEDNKEVINQSTLATMKPNLLLINTGRGKLINEPDLKKALESGRIAGAALDVLSNEPPQFDHPLTKLDNCILTPHHAWAAAESRARLLEIVFDNLRAYLKGNARNVVTAAFRNNH